jgi:hypothetical protein
MYPPREIELTAAESNKAMKRQHDTRLSISPYLDALEGVETQFALIRFALSKLSKGAIQGFSKGRLNQELVTNSETFKSLKGNMPQMSEVLSQAEEVVQEGVKKKYRKDSRLSDTRFRIELSEDRLNQSELLLLVAHFESFMKEVHRTFLTAAPAKVFSKRDTKVMLSEVFQDQAGNPFGRFLKELIIKEVKFLDAQRIERRAEYFLKRYEISFGSQNEIDGLKEIMETRNRISHEIYSPPPRTPEQVKDQALVADEMLKRARGLFRDVPKKCVEAGAKVYQSYFR